MTSVGTGIVSTGIQDYSHEMRLLQLRPDSSYTKTVPGGFTEFGSYSLSTRNMPSSVETIISFRSSAGKEYGAILYQQGLKLNLHLAGAVESYVKQ